MGPGGAGGPGEAFRDADSFLARAGLGAQLSRGPYSLLSAEAPAPTRRLLPRRRPLPRSAVPALLRCSDPEVTTPATRLPPVLNTALTPTPLFAPFRQRTPLLTGSREKRDLESFPMSGGCRKTGDAFKIIWKTLNCSFPQIFNEHM